MFTWEAFGTWKDKFEIRHLAYHRGELIACNGYMQTWRWANGFQPAMPEKVSDAARDDERLVAVLTAWSGDAVAILSDGSLLTLDVPGKNWARRGAPDSTMKADLLPLSAFDPERGLLVVWGSRKKSGGRKDETFVHDGKAWTKAKKSKVALADAANDEAGFSLYYDPNLRAVVRVGQTSVSTFDGTAWTQFPLRGGELLDNWDRIPFVLDGRALTVQRFITRKDVIEITRQGDGFAASRVATFPAAVDRKPNFDVGSNAAFDAGIFDAAGKRFLAFDDQKKTAYAATL